MESAARASLRLLSPRSRPMPTAPRGRQEPKPSTKSPGMLFDITSGGNGACTPPAEDEYLCAAKSGYDGPTGWGTPNGVFHLNGWVGQAITNLSAETNTKTNSLASVSCPAAESCYAVGHYLNKAGVETALAEHWNGTAWSIEETPEAYAKSALTGIWCDETTSCNAVGHAITRRARKSRWRSGGTAQRGRSEKFPIRRAQKAPVCQALRAQPVNLEKNALPWATTSTARVRKLRLQSIPLAAKGGGRSKKPPSRPVRHTVVCRACRVTCSAANRVWR